MSESDDYDNNSDYDDDDDYTEDDGYRMNSGADSSTNSSGLKTHASMLKHNDSEDSLSLSLDAQNGIPPSSDDSNRHRPKNMDQSSSRGLVRTGSGSVKFRNRSLSPAPNQRSPGSTPRSARAANKHKNGAFTSSPRNELTRTSNNSKKPPPASSPSGASKYSASKPPFDPSTTKAKLDEAFGDLLRVLSRATAIVGRYKQDCGATTTTTTTRRKRGEHATTAYAKFKQSTNDWRFEKIRHVSERCLSRRGEKIRNDANEWEEEKEISHVSKQHIRVCLGRTARTTLLARVD